MADDRLRKALAERYGDPSEVAAEQSAPPPAPAPQPVNPSDSPKQHRRRVLLDALSPKARAA
ncbi:hypothetical protein GA0070622_0916 [Micromonospora sediminicola]|uniref:Uncharacterized protein n=1 Tax=Micromonospora sediminicola TaxID=946078 RepID=A0A1A9B4A6_9ACTN|nr:hypothetical protein [Micromonospora sediminicola]SBT63948.1 hypothetical protein GA0070622_0916 [Micromonospora sediminicola]